MRQLRHSRLPLLLLAAALALPLLAPVWVRADGKDDGHRRITEYAEGNPYCPHRPIAVGRVVVPAKRCYTLAVFRNDRGAYLAFLDPAVRLHRHEAERLGSLEGRMAWNQILFLVPIPRDARSAMIPMNTIQLIRLREEDEEDEDRPRSALVLMVPAPAVPTVSATIVINF
ncbi:MAG TPA: hypothetical protein VJT33_10325 [bacterium]|nr:hypothetical protein [bacterium]